MALSAGSAPPSPRDRTDLHSVAPGTGVLFGLTFWGRLGSQLPRADGSSPRPAQGPRAPHQSQDGATCLSPSQEASGSLWVWPGLLSPLQGLAAGASWPPAIPGGHLSAETPLLAGTAWGRRCTVGASRSLQVALGRPLGTPAPPPASHVRELPPAPQPHLRSPGPYPVPVSLLRMLVPLGPRHLPGPAGQRALGSLTVWPYCVPGTGRLGQRLKVTWRSTLGFPIWTVRSGARSSPEPTKHPPRSLGPTPGAAFPRQGHLPSALPGCVQDTCHSSL